MSTTIVISQETVDMVARDLLDAAVNRPKGTPHSIVTCPYCSRENVAAVMWVRGEFLRGRAPLRALPGQRCHRCRGSLDVCVARDVIRMAA